MNYKISGGIRRNKKTIIIGLVLWAILTIVLVLPFTYATGVATEGGQLDLSEFLEAFTGKIASPRRNDIIHIFKRISKQIYVELVWTNNPISDCFCYRICKIYA